MTKSLNARIRDYLETLSEPVLPLAVATHLDAKPHLVRNTMTTMKAAGLILHEPGKGYTKGGRKPMTAKEAALRGGLAMQAKARLREVERLSAPRKEHVFVERPSKPGQPKSIKLEPRRLGMTEAVPAKEVSPCTETWLAANPEKLIRLEPGRWSTDLRFQY